MRRLDSHTTSIFSGEYLPIRIAANLAGLDAEDVIVECVVGRETKSVDFISLEHHLLETVGRNEKGETLFSLDLRPSLPGQQFYKLRMYPSHRLLANRFEAGYMIWL